PGAIYVMDRAYLDFARLYRFHCEGAFFLMRTKKHLRVRRRYSRPIADRSLIGCDQTVVLERAVARASYPAPLRRVRVREPDSAQSIVLLTNHFALPATTIGALYHHRWQIEIFFKWIKRHPRIKAFFGTSPNAVKTQVWIAVAVYVLIAIVRKRLHLGTSLYELLQILSVTLFEQTPLECALRQQALHESGGEHAKQLILFPD
ncbi:MAG: IS4 family transposase, partial [Gammaproteobacteria bacterium]